MWAPQKNKTEGQKKKKSKGDQPQMQDFFKDNFA